MKEGKEKEVACEGGICENPALMMIMMKLQQRKVQRTMTLVQS